MIISVTRRSTVASEMKFNKRNSITLGMSAQDRDELLNKFANSKTIFLQFRKGFEK